MGFVPQEDVMLRELNVKGKLIFIWFGLIYFKEILQHSAVIKNGTTNVNDIVERVISELKLSGMSRHLIVINLKMLINILTIDC